MSRFLKRLKIGNLSKPNGVVLENYNTDFDLTFKELGVKKEFSHLLDFARTLDNIYLK